MGTCGRRRRCRRCREGDGEKEEWCGGSAASQKASGSGWVGCRVAGAGSGGEGGHWAYSSTWSLVPAAGLLSLASGLSSDLSPPRVTVGAFVEAVSQPSVMTMVSEAAMPGGESGLYRALRMPTRDGAAFWCDACRSRDDHDVEPLPSCCGDEWRCLGN